MATDYSSLDPVTAAKVDAYRKRKSAFDRPVSEVNRAGAYAAGMAENARYKKMHDESELGQFESRMKDFDDHKTKDYDTYDTVTGRESDTSHMRGQLVDGVSAGDSAASPYGPQRDAPRSGYQKRNVRIYDQDLSPENQARVASMAVDNDVGKQSSYVDPRTGETVIMPRTVSVSPSRANRYLQQFGAEDARAESLRKTKVAEEERALAARRLDEDRAEQRRINAINEKNILEDRARRIKHEDFDNNLNESKAARAAANEDRAPMIEALQSRLESTKDPKMKAYLLRELTKLKMSASVNLPTNAGMGIGPVMSAVNSAVKGANDQHLASIPGDAFEPSALEQAQYESEQKRGMRDIQLEAQPEVLKRIESDYLVKSNLDDISREMASAQDLPWYNDLGDAFKFGIFAPAKTDDRRVQSVKARAATLASEIAAKHGISQEQAAAIVAAKLLEKVSDSTPGTAEQFRSALRTPTRAPMLNMPTFPNPGRAL